MNLKSKSFVMFINIFTVNFKQFNANKMLNNNKNNYYYFKTYFPQTYSSYISVINQTMSIHFSYCTLVCWDPLFIYLFFVENFV